MTAPTGPDRTGVVARLDALEAAHNAATPGEWTPATAPSEDSDETHAEYLTNALRPGDGHPLWVAWAPADGELHAGCDYVVPVVTGDGPTSEANARFVAAAHDAVPALIAAVRGVLAKCDAMEAEAPIGRFFAEEFRNVVAAALGEA